MFRLIEKSSGYLFSSVDLRGLIDQRLAAVANEVETLEQNRLINTAQADLVSYLVGKYSLEPPSLRREDWTADAQETQVDVRYDQSRWIDDKNRPFYIPGQRIDVEVPFDGEPELMYARASTSTTSPPRGEVRGQSLFLVYEVPHDSARDIKSEVERSLGEIERHLEWIRNDLQSFDRSLQPRAEQAIESRRQRILSNQGRMASLGIPIKTRADAPKTYAAPSVRKKVVPTLPAASSLPYEPEPVLDAETYEHILSVIQNMAHVMERSPSAFKSMGEEDLRQHFLVQLNGQFEGGATGETFNVGGKTDILVRASGRNIFIAECKFWKGPRKFLETIDQLLGYTAWRDTKTAILVFNRATGLSTVLAGVKEQAESHPNFKRDLSWKHETGFRYVFHHKDDPNREFILTVLVFDVPS